MQLMKVIWHCGILLKRHSVARTIIRINKKDAVKNNRYLRLIQETQYQ